MELKNFTGLANTVAAEAIPEGGLVEALNVDIDDAGRIRRRRGTQSVHTGRFHSLFQTSDNAVFVVRDGVFSKLNARMDTAPLLSVGDEKLHYVQVGDRIYAKSTTQAFSFDSSGSVLPWGIPHVPAFAVQSAPGAIFAGDCGVVATYIRTADGQEGGASEVRYVSTAGGILVSGIPDLEGHTANVYLSTGDSVFYLAATRVTGSTMLTSPVQRLGVPLRTFGMYPPVGRGPLAKSFGRVYVADGHVLWATEPHQFERVDRAAGYKVMESRITFLASVTQGVYIGTESGVFFMKGPFEDAKLTRIASVGAPDQTPQDIDVTYVLSGEKQGVGVMYITDGGICVGTSEGEVINMTSKQFEFPKATEVSTMFRRQDGLNQFVGVSSHPGSPTGSARFGDFVDAEIIRHRS